MLKDIVDIPQFLNIKEVKKVSKNFNKYFNDNLLENLRDFYVNDFQQFINLRKEIYIRGVSFQDNFRNNYLHYNEYENFPILFKGKDEKVLKEFSFKDFGLGNLVEDLSIESDYFLNYVPINSLENYVPKERHKVFEDKLKNLGYKFINSELELDQAKETTFQDISTEYYSIDERRINGRGSKDINIPCDTNLKTIFPSNLEYIEFMRNYFNEDNLLKAKPYNLGIEIIDKLIEEQKVDATYYNISKEKVLDELKKQPLYPNIINLRICDFFDATNTLSIFYNDVRYISELEVNFEDEFIAKTVNEEIRKYDVIDNLYNTLINNIDERKKFLLLERENGKTYEEIGDQIGVTRERVRQILSSTQTDIENSTFYKVVRILLKSKIKEKKILALNNFLTEINFMPEEQNIMKLVLNSIKGIELINNDKFIVNDKYYENIQNSVELIAKNNVRIDFNSIKGMNRDNEEIFQVVFNELNYKIIGNAFVKNKMTIVAAIECIFQMFPEMEIENNDKGFKKLKKLLKLFLDVDITSNKRSLFTRVEDAENVIQVNKKMYKYQDFSQIDDAFVWELENIIHEILKEKPYADPRQVYMNNGELMSNNGINSYYHLYSIIKQYLNDNFNIGFHNTMYIYKLNERNISSEDILMKYLQDNKLIEKSRLIKELGWKETKFEQVVPRLSNVVINEQNQVVTLYGIEEENAYFELLDYIESKFERGFCYTLDILLDIVGKEEYFKILQKYHIDNLMGLSQFIKSKLEDIKGFRLLLYSSQGKILNVEDVIVYDLPEIFAGNQLKEMLENKGFQTQRYYMCREKLIKDRKILPYKPNFYINTNKVEINDESRKLVLKTISNILKEKKFAGIKELEELRIPINDDLNLNVTPGLAASVAEEAGYQLLEAYQSSKYELPIVTTNEELSYDLLVYNIVQEEYQGNLEVKNLLNYLRYRGLIGKTKREPYDSLKNSQLFEFNNFGTFSLKKG